MNFKTLLESLITEATPQEIYDKFYKDIPIDIFKEIIGSDPQTVVSPDGIVRIGKYSKMLLNLYKKKNLKLEDIGAWSDYLGYIYKHQIPSFS